MKIKFPLTKEKVETFTAKHRRDIIYIVLCVVFVFGCISWAYFRIKDFDNRLKSEIEKTENKYEEKIAIIDNTYISQTEEIKKKYDIKLTESQKKYQRAKNELERRRRGEIENADTPEKRVRLGINYINKYSESLYSK